MRCDLHVHTRHSGMCHIPLLRRVCRECYSDPLALYDSLKRLGMDLVTVTDHDSIDAVEALRGRPDFFLSEEVTCRLPSGTEVHIGVYGISEREHIEIQRRRVDFESLAAFLRERRVFFSANHVFSSLTGRRVLADFDLFASAFPALETRNGHMLPRANRNAAMLAHLAARAEVGGSDAHVMASAGRAWTVVPHARTREDYLAGLRAGQGFVRGECGGYWKLTRDLLAIGAGMVAEKPAAALLAPLALAVPFVTLGNLAVESVFARFWMARYVRARISRDRAQAAGPAMEAAV